MGRKAAILAICFVFFPTAAFGEESTAGTVDEAFAEGQRLYRAGNIAAAIVFFENAYREHHVPDFLQNIGRCHQRLGQFCDAARYYRLFLDESEDLEADIETRIRESITGFDERCREQSTPETDPDPDPDPDADPDPTLFGQGETAPPYDPSRLYIASYVLWGIGAAFGIVGGICWGVTYSDRFEVDGASALSYAGDGMFFGAFIPMAVAGLVTYLVGYFLARRSQTERRQTALEINYAFAEY